jgi:hypothetical protein
VAIATEMMGATESEPHCLAVSGRLAPASTLLLHMARLRGVKIVAKKSWALTDDFEAYFTFKGRLFIMHTPMVDVWLAMIGQPPDDALFAEVEAHVQKFRGWHYLLAPVALVRFFGVPFNPPRALLEAQGIDPAKWWR